MLPIALYTEIRRDIPYLKSLEMTGQPRRGAVEEGVARQSTEAPRRNRSSVGG